MKSIIKLIEKAEKNYIQHRFDCENILEAIEHMLPNNDDGLDLSFDVFMQTDGICISDLNANNYPVTTVVSMYADKGERLTYEELQDAAI